MKSVPVTCFCDSDLCDSCKWEYKAVWLVNELIVVIFFSMTSSFSPCLNQKVDNSNSFSELWHHFLNSSVNTRVFLLSDCEFLSKDLTSNNGMMLTLTRLHFQPTRLLLLLLRTFNNGTKMSEKHRMHAVLFWSRREFLWHKKNNFGFWDDYNSNN